MMGKTCAVLFCKTDYEVQENKNAVKGVKDCLRLSRNKSWVKANIDSICQQTLLGPTLQAMAVFLLRRIVRLRRSSRHYKIWKRRKELAF